MRPGSTAAQTTTRTTEVAGADTHTLSGEHAILIRDVERRAAPVLALHGTGTWPHAELGALIRYLRTTVLRHASDEETLLNPDDASAPPFAELSADHVRLHVLTTQLEAANAEGGSRTDLGCLVDDLVNTLREHLSEEQGVLAALAKTDVAVPSAADLAATRRGWLSIEDASIQIQLDAFPESQATEMCIERLLRLRPGQAAEVHAREGWRLQTVCRWLHAFDATRFGLERTRIGSDHLLRVTSRHATAASSPGFDVE